VSYFGFSNCQNFKKNYMQSKKKKKKLLHTCIFWSSPQYFTSMHISLLENRGWMDEWMDGWMDGKILPTSKSERDLGPWGKI